MIKLQIGIWFLNEPGIESWIPTSLDQRANQYTIHI